MEQNNHTKKLTVAIPTYNREKYLTETLANLTSQTFKEFNIVLFDNGSEYDIHNFIEIFPQLNIQILSNEKNMGAVSNFKRLIYHDFKSDYVIILHDDDTIHPKYFETAMPFLDNHPEVNWLGSNINFVEENGFSKMDIFENKPPNTIFEIVNQQELVEKIMEGFSLGFPTVIYRSAILKKFKARDEEFEKWGDRPMLIDLAENGKVALTDGKFMNYRIHTQKESLIKKPTDIYHLLNLFRYYKEKSEDPNSIKFKICETANSINTVTQMSTTFDELNKNLSIFRKENMFNFRYVRVKGLYYFLKFILRKIRRYVYNKTQ